MLAKKIRATLTLTIGVCMAALVTDYVTSDLLLKTPQLFNPLKTLAVTLAVCVPVAYYLISQKINIQTVEKRLLEILSQEEKGRVEVELANGKMKESEALYRLLADNQTDMISLWDADGINLYTSPSSERRFGFSNGERRALENYSNIHPEDRSILEDLTPRVTAESGPATAEFRIIHKNGTVEWVESTLTRVGDGSGGLLSATRVITERKHLQQELEAALGKAQMALAVKADFLANMTHELRTPLNAIVGFSGLLRKSANIKQPESRQVELIYDASQTLLSVVNDVLDFSKLEAGAVELEHHSFDPVQIAEATIALLSAQAAEKGIGISVTTTGEHGPLIGDSARLRQVILNLSSNALKFTASGGIEVVVDQQDDGAQRRLRIAVNDSGIGIPERHIDAVFGRFTQADASVSRKFGGTGLGLSICKKLIDAMGGDIGVKSVEGSGSTFWFEVTLPIAASLDDHYAAPTEMDIESTFRLLVVDDNPTNRELIVALLAPFDISITTASDGVEAVEHAARSQFDLILMDVQMPNMDGMTATRRIRSSTPLGARRVPIVAMTANVFPEQVARCLEAGMDGHLGKPINPAKFIETLAFWSSDGAEEEACELSNSTALEHQG
jgi:PAS domain S-box-containing protein